MKKISLFKYINDSLAPSRWITSFGISILLAISFAVFDLKNKLDANKLVVDSLAPYLSTLVESSDRPEILRVLHSVSLATKSDVILVQDGRIFATSRSIEELDQKFSAPQNSFEFFITKKEIKNDAAIFVFSPLLPFILKSIIIFFSIFLLSLVIFYLFSKKMKKVIKSALAPIDQLHAEIKAMIEDSNTTTAPIQIKELEEIRTTVQKTKIDLENAKDQLAETKAKKLSAESYKRLIHDLHNPVAALRQMARLAFDESTSADIKEEATSSIPRLVEQILKQVTAANKNLEDEPVALRDLDIASCVQDSIKQMESLGIAKKISLQIKTSPLRIPHDPTLLKRAIVNLLENAVDAAEDQVRVTLSKSKNSALIQVCDDGAGMNEELIPIYFQGRGQSGKANRQAFGLSSTNHIVRSHQGKLIYRKSDLGGSSFEIQLGGIC